MHETSIANAVVAACLESRRDPTNAAALYAIRALLDQAMMTPRRILPCLPQTDPRAELTSETLIERLGEFDEHQAAGALILILLLAPRRFAEAKRRVSEGCIRLAAREAARLEGVSASTSKVALEQLGVYLSPAFEAQAEFLNGLSADELAQVALMVIESKSPIAIPASWQLSPASSPADPVAILRHWLWSASRGALDYRDWTPDRVKALREALVRGWEKGGPRWQDVSDIGSNVLFDIARAWEKAPIEWWKKWLTAESPDLVSTAVDLLIYVSEETPTTRKARAIAIKHHKALLLLEGVTPSSAPPSPWDVLALSPTQSRLVYDEWISRGRPIKWGADAPLVALLDQWARDSWIYNVPPFLDDGGKSAIEQALERESWAGLALPTRALLLSYAAVHLPPEGIERAANLATADLTASQVRLLHREFQLDVERTQSAELLDGQRLTLLARHLASKTGTAAFDYKVAPAVLTSFNFGSATESARCMSVLFPNPFEIPYDCALLYPHPDRIRRLLPLSDPAFVANANTAWAVFALLNGEPSPSPESVEIAKRRWAEFSPGEQLVLAWGVPALRGLEISERPMSVEEWQVFRGAVGTLVKRPSDREGHRMMLKALAMGMKWMNRHDRISAMARIVQENVPPGDDLVDIAGAHGDLEETVLGQVFKDGWDYLTASSKVALLLLSRGRVRDSCLIKVAVENKAFFSDVARSQGIGEAIESIAKVEMAAKAVLDKAQRDAKDQALGRLRALSLLHPELCAWGEVVQSPDLQQTKPDGLALPPPAADKRARRLRGQSR